MADSVPLTHRIDLSFLGDILQRVEGEPIDLRTDAVVTFHTEAENRSHSRRALRGKRQEGTDQKPDSRAGGIHLSRSAHPVIRSTHRSLLGGCAGLGG